MKTWFTVKNNCVDRIMQTNDKDVPTGEGWQQASNDWNGNHGDKLEWFDADMRRIADSDLVARGIRADNRGTVYNIVDMSSRQIQKLDEEIQQNETGEAPCKMSRTRNSISIKINGLSIPRKKKKRSRNKLYPKSSPLSKPPNGKYNEVSGRNSPERQPPRMKNTSTK